MSTLTAMTAGLFDPSLTTSSARGLPPAQSRPDESFWQNVFDRAETLGLATVDAAMPVDSPNLNGHLVAAKACLGEPASTAFMHQPAETSRPPQEGNISLPSTALRTEAGNIAKPLGAMAMNSVPVRHPLQADQWQAAQSYGMAPAEPTALPSAAITTNAPPLVNVTLVTLPNGELKLYLRAAGLSTTEALAAASLADLPWPSGQAPDISEVVLNGQTIYSRGAGTAPSFILTC